VPVVDYLIAFAICVAAAAFEGLCAGRAPLARLAALRQPAWSPPIWLWVLIGIAWYGLCFTGLVRLLPHWPDHRAPVLLLVALMAANGAVNLLQFRMNRLDLAFFSFGPYWLLLAAFLWTACPLDPLTCALFAVYAAYQVYAAAWGYRLWRMAAVLESDREEASVLFIRRRRGDSGPDP
jgi:tryptophan-rich sensory protein